MGNPLTMAYGKPDINGYGMNITCFPQKFVEIEFSSGHAEMDQGTGWDIEEVIGVLPSFIGESGHVIDRMVVQWII